MASDDGNDWRAVRQRFEFAAAPKRDDYLGEDYRFDPPLRTRMVRFHAESTHRAGGQPDLAGLGKVRFFESDDAPPADGSADDVDGSFPAGAGVVNVRRPPYLAKGDGVADDTSAIQ